MDWHKRIDEEIEKESSIDTVSNIFRLRRIFQTPTLTFFAPLQREETHRVIRKFKKYKDYFYRLSLTTENLSFNHFGGEMKKNVLDFMIGVLGRGITVGGNQSNIVNYSNS